MTTTIRLSELSDHYEIEAGEFTFADKGTHVAVVCDFPGGDTVLCHLHRIAQHGRAATYAAQTDAAETLVHYLRRHGAQQECEGSPLYDAIWRRQRWINDGHDVSESPTWRDHLAAELAR